MHQDQRVGLALGVLLVGACAAFFFRNETRLAPNAPRLQHAKELDDRIAERSTRPYLKGIEAVETADRRRSTGTTDQAHSSDDDAANYWSPLDTADDKLAKTKPPRFHRPNRPLDPSNDVQEMAPITIPNDSRFPADTNQGTVSNTEATAGRSQSKSGNSAPDGRPHVVQKGETLSSIAAKTLGSPSRFHDLFEANQDQLKDPNDVKLGMTLRIPELRTESAAKPSHTKTRSVIETEVLTAEPIPVPVDSLSDSAPPAFETNSLVPPQRSQDSPSILMPPELPNTIPVEPSNEPTPIDEPGTGKKFVPARRSPIPGRPIGPQAKNTGTREVTADGFLKRRWNQRPEKSHANHLEIIEAVVRNGSAVLLLRPFYEATGGWGAPSSEAPELPLPSIPLLPRSDVRLGTAISFCTMITTSPAITINPSSFRDISPVEPSSYLGSSANRIAKWQFK